jgi:hypothetical protein
MILKILNLRLNDYIKTVDKVLRTPDERIAERNRMNEYLRNLPKRIILF